MDQPLPTLTDKLAAKLIPVMEIFGPTVQGEGAVIGLQTYFIRFGLCDFKCKMCDSMHAVDGKLVNANANWWNQDQIFDEFVKFRNSQGGDKTTEWVTFSGGNPLIHDLNILTHAMSDEGFNIAVETQGTIYHDWLFDCQHITISPKGPGMGEKCDLNVLDAFMDQVDTHPGISMKVVVFDQRDLDHAQMLFERYVWVQGILRPSQFFLSLGNPHPPGMDQEAGHYVLRDRLVTNYKNMLNDIQRNPILSQVKFLPQWHVIVWGNKQGV